METMQPRISTTIVSSEARNCRLSVASSGGFSSSSWACATFAAALFAASAARFAAASSCANFAFRCALRNSSSRLTNSDRFPFTLSPNFLHCALSFFRSVTFLKSSSSCLSVITKGASSLVAPSPPSAPASLPAPARVASSALVIRSSITYARPNRVTTPCVACQRPLACDSRIRLKARRRIRPVRFEPNSGSLPYVARHALCSSDHLWLPNIATLPLTWTISPRLAAADDSRISWSSTACSRSRALNFPT
mmetsp:Transcript_26322/g.70228  ORF Transcript_26322/g.70228 Transcript_26322/m.70228 type:complete len:251 (+) Transcript_26322:5615-6367(+)